MEHNMRFSLKKKGKIVVWVFILILVIFLLNVFQKEVRGVFYCFSAPIQKVLFRTGDRVSDFFESFIKIKSLKSEVDDLKIKNQELLSQIVTLKEIEEENETLREALGIELQKEFKLTLAQIIGKDISQDFILIDKGLEDDISEKMPVITQQKVLVGKISDVYKNYSKVMLISNKKSSFDAEIQKNSNSKNDISGVVKGEGSFKIIFDLLPREANIFQKDVVITSSIGGIFPKGLLVGQIKEVKKSDVDPFQQAKIEPAFDIKNINNLFVILDF